MAISSMVPLSMFLIGSLSLTSAICLANFMTVGGMRNWRRSFLVRMKRSCVRSSFDTNNLLGVDSDEDVEEDVVSVKLEDYFSEIFSEEAQLRRDRVKEILETKIVRLSPVNSDSEDEETMERVASPMVVETVNDLADAGVASCSTDIDVNNQLGLTSAAKPDRVEKIVTVRVELPSVPGPYSEDVSLDDFVPRTRPGPVLFLTFREPASGEVSVHFPFSYPVVYILLLNSGA